jgi:hypothetical protein
MLKELVPASASVVDDTRQVLLLDGIGGVARQAGGIHAGDQQDIGGDAHGGDFLEAEGQGQQTHIGTAVLLRYQAAQQAQVGKGLPHVFREYRVVHHLL